MIHEPSELIENREIEATDADKLGHEDLVQQLHQIVLTVPTPSNIALYGAWGSGKSGIGKLLESRIRVEKGVEFVRFDAFKYAQNPLRRNFISVVANALGAKDHKFHRNLYSGVVNTDFTVPADKVWRLIGVFSLITSVSIALMLAVVAILAGIQGRDILDAFNQTFQSALPSTLLPAALLTALIALIGKTFVEERRVERADSDEEFEELFRSLVTLSKASKIVIFVDELDRCAPHDVVATLDSVRTFFGVEGCVFIVASDPQVLEQALSDGSKQANPADTTNPYYSAGSEYLDKVFQYQLTVPPLMSQSVTSFAVDLVKTRSGVWQKVNVPVISSILIPTHVRSPRRVKNLLNAFVLAYRLAESRQQSGLLELDIANEAEELARIVCLRVEFPLFARDLTSDPDLSTYVLELSETAEDEVEDYWKSHASVSTRTRRIAHEYAERSRAVDQSLVDIGPTASGRTKHEVNQAHGQQLLDYLSRTRMVTGSTKALIHLQDSGPLYGLPAALADQLERDALNGSVQAMRKLNESLNDTERISAIDLLTQLARTSPGYEGQNVARSLFAFLTDTLPDGKSESVLMAIGPIVQQSPSILTAETALGAWRLSLASKRAEARKLGFQILLSELPDEDSAVLRLVLAHSSYAASLNETRLGEILRDHILGNSPRQLIDLLDSIDGAERRAALAALQNVLPKALKAAILTRKTWESKQAGVEDGSESDAADGEEPLDPKPALSEIVDFIVRLLPVDPGSAESLFNTVMDVGSGAARNSIRDRSSELTNIAAQPSTAARVLKLAPKLHFSWWPSWLKTISEAALPQSDETSKILRSLSSSLGKEALAWSDERAEKIARSCARTLVSLTDQLSDDQRKSATSAAADVGDHVVDSKDIQDHVERLNLALVFAHEGLTSVDEVWESEAQSLASTLESDIEAGSLVDVPALVEFVLDSLRDALLKSSASGPSSISRETQARILTAARDGDWFGETASTRITALAVARYSPALEDAEIAAPDAETIRRAKEELSSPQYQALVCDWLMATSEELSSILTVVEPLLQSRVRSSEFLTSLTHWRTQAGAHEQHELVKHFVGEVEGMELPEPVLEALGLSSLPNRDAAEIIAARFNSARNNPQRVLVLAIWAAADVRERNSRAHLIKEVLVPLIGSGVTAAGPAIRYLDLLAKPVPPAVKSQLGEAVLTAAKGRGFERDALRALKALGYKIDTQGLFKRKKSIRTPPEIETVGQKSEEGNSGMLP